MDLNRRKSACSVSDFANPDYLDFLQLPVKGIVVQFVQVTPVYFFQPIILKFIKMKTLRLFIAVLFAVSLNLQANTVNQNSTPAAVQSAKTETFKVWGKCEMCKARIEKTVRAEGAANADRNIKTQMLTVTYDPSKTSKDALSKKLAAVGHDTEKYKAPDDIYAKLPSCCHYERADKQ